MVCSRTEFKMAAVQLRSLRTEDGRPIAEKVHRVSSSELSIALLKIMEFHVYL